MASPRAYGFGPFRVFPGRRQVLRGEAVVPLTPKAFDTLVTLIERRDRVASKEELLRHLWPDVVVEEASLTQQIFLLRKALDDTPDGERYIATVPRRGYRFVADVTEIPTDGAPALAGTITEPAAPQGGARFIAQRAFNPRMWIGFGVVVGLLAVGAYLLGPDRLRWFGRTPAIELTFTRLTTEPTIESFPSLSPDGRWFVYAVGPLDYAGDVDIYLRGVGLDNAINLTPNSPGADTQPAFSPDGESIAFRSDRLGGGIFVMRRTGESVRRITDVGFNPAWSPDGKQLAYSTENVGASPAFRAARGQLWTVDMATGERRMVVDGDAEQPHWSPHGHRIAYWGSQRAIYTVAATGGKPTLVAGGADTPPGQFYWNPVWSPNGRYMYFSSDRGGSMNLWRVRIDEHSGDILEAPEPVTTPSTFAAHLSFSTAGDRLAFAAVPLNAAIHRVDFDPSVEKVVGTPVAITKGSGNWVWPEASPDGRRLAFHSAGAPQQEDIYVSDADGTGRRQLTNDAFADRLARWSPDGRRIAFYSTRSGRWNIWVVNADGSGLRQVTAGSGPQVLFPVWSPDGSRMAATDGARSFIFDPTQPWDEKKLIVLPVLDGHTHFVPWSWSPDGTRLAGQASRPSRPQRGGGVWILSLKEGTYTALTDFGSTPLWLSDGRRLLFAADSRVLLVDSVSKVVRELLSFGPSRVQLAAGGGFSISTDDRHIYVAPVVRDGDVWMATFKR